MNGRLILTLEPDPGRRKTHLMFRRDDASDIPVIWDTSEEYWWEVKIKCEPMIFDRPILGLFIGTVKPSEEKVLISHTHLILYMIFETLI